MNWSKGVIAGAFVMHVAACGGSAPKSASTSATTPAAPFSTSVITPVLDVGAELLTVSDLPAGWSAVPNNGSTSGEPKCLQNVKTDLKATSKAEATFEDGSNGVPLLDEALFYLPGQGRAAMTDVSRILSRCGQIRLTSGGHTLTGTFGAMSFPAVADQSAAYQINLSATASGVTITVGIDLIMFRKADTVALMLYADIGTPDIQTVEHFVQDAAAKLS